MLRVYGRYLGVLRSMRPVIAAIGRRDRSLARHLTDAAASVALNLSEGSGCEGGARRQRNLTALGSAREVVSALEVADALGYVALCPQLMADLSGVVGTLVVLVMGRRR